MSGIEEALLVLADGTVFEGEAIGAGLRLRCLFRRVVGAQRDAVAVVVQRREADHLAAGDTDFQQFR